VWIFYSILSAFGWSTSDLFSKKALGQGYPETALLWIRYLLSLPFLLPFLFFIDVPHLDAFFFRLHFVWLPAEITALFLYLRAIKLSPLSLTIPYLSLTPVFLIATQYFILGEKINSLAFPGIMLVVLGSYLLTTTASSGSALNPVRALLREKGSLLMVLVALLYSFTSVFGKLLIEHSSPLFFSAYYAFLMALILSPVGFRSAVKAEKGAFRSVFLASIFFALMIASHMLALFRANVAYMIALKRLSGVFSVIYGGIFLKERFLWQRLLAALLMVGGAVIIGIMG